MGMYSIAPKSQHNSFSGAKSVELDSSTRYYINSKTANTQKRHLKVCSVGKDDVLKARNCIC